MGDSGNNGMVSVDELQTALKGMWPEAHVEAITRALMGSDGGDVSYEEFMGELVAATAPVENELLWRLFAEADRHSKGYLDVGDVQALLRRPAVAKVLGDRKPQDLLQEVDMKCTGRIDFEDFKFALQGSQRKSQRTPLFVRRVRSLEVGQKMEYHSTTHGTWISCEVTGVDLKSGAVQVNCRPGWWIHSPEMQTKLRHPPSGLYWPNCCCPRKTT